MYGLYYRVVVVVVLFSNSLALGLRRRGDERVDGELATELLAEPRRSCFGDGPEAPLLLPFNAEPSLLLFAPVVVAAAIPMTIFEAFEGFAAADD